MYGIITLEEGSDIMFCRNCGQPLEYSVTVCNKCGTKVDNETKADPIVTQTAGRDSGNKKEQDSNVFLILSIIALGFRSTPVISMIFSIISMVKVNKYKKAYGSCQGTAKIGEVLTIVTLVLSIIQLITSIIAVAFVVLMYALMFIAAIAGSGMYGGVYM